MKVISLVTDKKQFGYVKWLKPSCAHHQLELLQIYYDKRYPSHKLKDLLLLNYLKKKAKDEIILFTDAYDTTFLTDEQEILNKFYSFQSPLVFSAEINCFPDRGLEKEYPKDSQKYFFKYLNSGGFIGESQYIIELIEKYYNDQSDIDHNKYTWSNQYIWNQIYLKEQKLIKLDNYGEIFYTLSSKMEYCTAFLGSDTTLKQRVFEKDKERISKEVIFEKDRVRSSKTGTSPCQIHFTSPIAKFLMQTDFFDAIKR